MSESLYSRTYPLSDFDQYASAYPDTYVLPDSGRSMQAGDATVGGGTGYGPLGSTSENVISGLGPAPGSLDRSFGQSNYATLGALAGSALGAAAGLPGAGLALGALGTLADVRGLNADLAAMGLPQDISFPSALASNMTFGLAGTPASAQFGNIMGFDALAEAPLSAFSSPGYSTPAAATAEMEAQAMAQGLQSPTYGTGTYGFGTDPSIGGSGDFGAMSSQERGDSSGPSGPGGSTDSAADSPGAGGGVGADGSVGSGGDAWKKGGLVKFAEGGLVPLAGGGKIAIGPGGGLDDLIPTSINGRRAAALSDGEFVIPADVVSMMGDGSSNAGSRRLYDLVRQIREAKTGTDEQAGPLPVGTILKRTLS